MIYSARQSEVLIYCIGLLNDEAPRGMKAAKRELRALAEASGGQDYYPKDVAEIERIMPRVANEIRSQYMLAYSPLNPSLDGTFRRIKVEVTGFGRATVRTRNGYYANPTPPPKASVPRSGSDPERVINVAQVPLMPLAVETGHARGEPKRFRQVIANARNAPHEKPQPCCILRQLE